MTHSWQKAIFRHALSRDGEITDVNEEETVIRKFMLSHAKENVFLCSKERIGEISQHKVAMLDAVEYVVSDEKFPSAFEKKYSRVQFICSDAGCDTKRR